MQPSWHHSYVYSILLVRLSPLVSILRIIVFRIFVRLSARDTFLATESENHVSNLARRCSGDTPRLKHRVCVRSQLMGPVSCLVRRVSLRLTPLPHFASPLHFISPTPRFISLSFWLTSSLARASRRINDRRFFFRRYQWLAPIFSTCPSCPTRTCFIYLYPGEREIASFLRKVYDISEPSRAE